MSQIIQNINFLAKTFGPPSDPFRPAGFNVIRWIYADWMLDPHTLLII